jgi:hypothetical protein
MSAPPRVRQVASTTLHGPLEWNARLIEGDIAEDRRCISSKLG